MSALGHKRTFGRRETMSALFSKLEREDAVINAPGTA
jgi:hypothetical protein